MSEYPGGTLTALSEQAPDSANYFLTRAVQDIDQLFGNGHAKQTPALVAAYLCWRQSESDPLGNRNLTHPPAPPPESAIEI